VLCTLTRSGETMKGTRVDDKPSCLNPWSECLTRMSRSSPERWVSPVVALTYKKTSSIVRSETSKKEEKTPPKSKMRMFL
jgi:hypothetical protein